MASPSSTMDAKSTQMPSHQLRAVTILGNSAANDDAGDSPPGSPRSASISLQAAATMNAGLQHERSRRSSSSSVNRHNQPSPSAGRRRSVVLMNLHLNDPAIPSPGEMVNDHASGLRTSGPQSMVSSPVLMARDPHHKRAPSLGGLHQEMEEEQEAHVNRMLKMIRKEQEEARHLQETKANNNNNNNNNTTTTTTTTTTGTDDGTLAPAPASERNPSNVPKPTRSPNGSFNLQKRWSRTPSGTTSPGLPPTSARMDSGDYSTLPSRDEVALLQAERVSLIRENQVLKRRVVELEEEITEITSKPPGLSHSPSHHSHLVQSSTMDDEATKGAAD